MTDSLQTIVVTGGGGFVGRAISEALRDAGFAVRALRRPGGEPVAGVKTVIADLTVPASIPDALAGASAVVHAASIGAAHDPAEYRLVNIEGTANLLQALPDGVRLVHISSLAAQGPSPAGLPHTDAGDEQPLDGYGESRLEADRLVQRAARDDGTAATILRPALLWGRDGGDLERVRQAVVAGLVPSGADLQLSAIHVDDLAGLVIGLLRQAEPAGLGPYLLSDGRIYTLDEVVSLLNEGREARGPRIQVPRGVLSALGGIASSLAQQSMVPAWLARSLADLGASGWACLPDQAVDDLGFRPTRFVGRSPTPR